MTMDRLWNENANLKIENIPLKEENFSLHSSINAVDAALERHHLRSIPNLFLCCFCCCRPVIGGDAAAANGDASQQVPSPTLLAVTAAQEEPSLRFGHHVQSYMQQPTSTSDQATTVQAQIGTPPIRTPPLPYLWAAPE